MILRNIKDFHNQHACPMKEYLWRALKKLYILLDLMKAIPGAHLNFAQSWGNLLDKIH